MTIRNLGIALTACALFASAVPAQPAFADGAASTRNIILGGALVGGTLLILNHNKKVHQKEDELSNGRAQAQAERDQAYAERERAQASASSYQHQLALTNNELATMKHTIAVQHDQIVTLRNQVSMSQHLSTNSTSFLQSVPSKAVGPSTPDGTRVAAVSYGWGQL